MGLSWLSQRDLVLVLVLTIMVTSATEYTGDNVCQRVENFTTTVNEKYMEPIVVRTFDWCFQVPPRCPKSRVELRERWRIKTQIQQRTVMECCDGYREVKKDDDVSGESLDIRKCEPHCDVCQHGSCVAPNVCHCWPGFEGDRCVDECPPGTWGEKCSQLCQNFCHNSESCDHVNGKCNCSSGWRGPSCNEKCPTGFWGPGCDSPCHCEHSIALSLGCDHVTGSCDADSVETQHSPPSETSLIESLNTDRGLFPTSGNDYNEPYSIPEFENKTDNNAQTNIVTERTQELPTRSSSPFDAESEKKASVGTFTGDEKSSSETSSSSNRQVPPIDKIETSSIATRIVTIEHDVQQPVEVIETKVSRVEKPSTSGSVVTVVRVSGNGSPNRDGSMIMTSLDGADKIPNHTAPMPLDVAALIVVGSILSLGLTTLAVLAILHIRSKLFETIRLSLYDAEKRATNSDTIRRGHEEKGNPGTISSLARNSSTLACEYETPRCMVPEHRTLGRSRPAPNIEVTKNQESSYSNVYPNIRLFSNLQELLEAHYDRPPSTFRPTDPYVEHVYDEIPLQSSTTFATTKRDP